MTGWRLLRAGTRLRLCRRIRRADARTDLRLLLGPRARFTDGGLLTASQGDRESHNTEMRTQESPHKTRMQINQKLQKLRKSNYDFTPL